MLLKNEFFIKTFSVKKHFIYCYKNKNILKLIIYNNV
mgnify:CR=1 FL=1